MRVRPRPLTCVEPDPQLQGTDRCVSATPHETETACLDHRPYVCAILRAIHAAPFNRQLNARALKSVSGTRNHNVASEFKRVVGYSIMGYVLKLRVDAAAQRLSIGRETVATISRSVGFCSIQRFYATFAHHFGETPAAYAKRHRKRQSESTAGSAQASERGTHKHSPSQSAH